MKKSIQDINYEKKTIKNLLPSIIKMLITNKKYYEIFNESEYCDCVKMMRDNGVILYYFLDYHYDFDLVNDCIKQYIGEIA